MSAQIEDGGAAKPMTESVLKGCPFCGGPAEVRDGPDGESAYVQCLDVKMHRALWVVGDNNAAGEAAEAWNTRASDQHIAELKAEGERLREALEVAEQAYQTGILFDETNLHGRAIVLRRAALRAGHAD